MMWYVSFCTLVLVSTHWYWLSIKYCGVCICMCSNTQQYSIKYTKIFESNTLNLAQNVVSLKVIPFQRASMALGNGMIEE